MKQFLWPIRRLRQLHILMTLIAVFLFVLASFSHAQETQTPNTPDCVVAAFYPPFVIADRDENAGISIEVIRAAAKRAGREISIEFMPFQRALYTLNKRPNCMMPALFRNESREGSFRWIETYHAAELRFMTLGTPINSIEEGRKLTSIGVETESSADQFLSSLGFENLVRIASTASSAQMLQAGRIDAWAQSATAAQGLWDDLGLQPALQTGDAIYSVPIYVTAGLQYPDDIAAIYQKAIKSIVTDGTVAGILAKYR